MEGEEFYTRALRRLYLSMYWLTIGGTAGAGALFGWRNALAFVASALASLAWFRGAHLIAQGLTGKEAVSRGKRVAVALIRFVVILAGVYAILNLTGASVFAPLAGFSIPVFAILVEAVYQVLYARA